MPARKLSSQFPSIPVRRVASFDEISALLRDMVIAIEELRKQLIVLTADHADLLDGLQLPVKTDASRGAAGTEGRVIFNSDDGLLNIDDGTNWTLPDGTST